MSDRITKGFAELLAKLRGAPADSKLAAAQIGRQVAAGTDRDIAAQWRALGVNVVPSHNGKPISVSLAKQLGLIRVEPERQEAV